MRLGAFRVYLGGTKSVTVYTNSYLFNPDVRLYVTLSRTYLQTYVT